MRPHAGDDKEPVPRRESISRTKQEAESTPKEEQPVLGWGVNTHRPLLRLPHDKFVAYSNDIPTTRKQVPIIPFTMIQAILRKLSQTARRGILPILILATLGPLQTDPHRQRKRSISVVRRTKET